MDIVPELDVVIGAAQWLHARGARLMYASLAAGSQTGRYADQTRFREALATAGIDPSSCSLVPDGPDIIAFADTEHWLVACKGAGRGVQSTQRNNFDRPLASVVSYYHNPPGYVAEALNGASAIALALPSTAHYMRELRRRVRVPLRQRLNLWVLLFDPATKAVTAVAPDADYPAPAAP